MILRIKRDRHFDVLSAGNKKAFSKNANSLNDISFLHFFPREPAINPHISVCKPPLKKNMVCGPINFFRTVYVGAEVQTACGPCEKELICKQVG